jgi:hypothetical protein
MAAEFQEIWAAGTDEFRKEISLSLRASIMGTTVSFYNSLSMMAYGAPMSEWVKRAAEGDVQAYYKA